ncbi:hypothetical protein pqer_cds_324 [Pandoravirus quercus]|uniref:Uncharacterized protein n=2 Tax=Pandoravirus TaxID=2060084 RepID=A0A2U7U8J1_9VIRU|nr:hypothetical protein pqer_cds_324 [Pandoravirus quercus]AVK74746.1 hypothetical protein pqer_cds_324 [Pandoravirus quercus]QBZ80923.1 hypothetical protein pclt_cds_325 [Pandoravirus celtis]
MSRDPWGLLPLSGSPSPPSPSSTMTSVRSTPTSSMSPAKMASVRADRRAASGRLAVRRGGLVGILAGVAGFYMGDVSSCFGADQRALAYVSALPVCGVLSGLCGAACASLAVAILPRRRHRRLALGVCALAGAASLPFVHARWPPASPK